SHEDILRYFASRYGESILLSPPRSGFTLLVWTAPYVGVAAALGFLVWAVRRAGPAADSEALLSPPPTGEGRGEGDLEGHSASNLGEGNLDPYLREVDATVDRLKDEPVRLAPCCPCCWFSSCS